MRCHGNKVSTINGVIFLSLFSLPGFFSPPQNPSNIIKHSHHGSPCNATEGSKEIPVKKMFVKFVQGPFTFKTRKEKCGRVTFTCNGCQKFNYFLFMLAWVERVGNDLENNV